MTDPRIVTATKSRPKPRKAQGTRPARRGAIHLLLGPADPAEPARADRTPRWIARLRAAADPAGSGPSALILPLSAATYRQLGGTDLTVQDHHGYHLPPDCRTILLALRQLTDGLPPGAAAAYPAAKSVELICEFLRQRREGRLLPLSSGATISADDTRKILEAREFITTRCDQKLTLDGVARAAGLNRAKLTRGFRALFAQSVAEMIAETRLGRARDLLMTTDLPVGAIGHESGFRNNASFARAFGRHFGRSPTEFRVNGLRA